MKKHLPTTKHRKLKHINLSQYKEHLQIKKQEGVTYIYDIIRKKYIILQPEELVRQLLIHYLIEERGYRKNYIQVEKQFTLNGRIKRFDIIVYDEQIQPYILVECKAPKAVISQKTFDQAAQYNFTLHAPFIIISNGVSTHSCYVDTHEHTYKVIAEVPSYKLSSEEE